ncbi:MAG: class I SAM-dependent methyltransferase [Blastocatellia bacterium]
MSNEKELAYRYDLMIAPDWRERFDTLLTENVKLPTEGRILEVNCGTGALAVELAEKMRGRGDVSGTDSSAERIEIARAKALVKKIDEAVFEQSSPDALRFDSFEFDAVIGDASMLPPDEIEDMTSEMVRVAQPDAPIILKMITSGSFDEFFSIYWEVLLGAGLSDEIWADLEALIKARASIDEAERMAVRAGLRKVKSFTSKEEFSFETGNDFVEAPLIKDVFLPDWLAIIPQEQQEEIREQLVSVIDRERYDALFDISIKATLITGIK